MPITFDGWDPPGGPGGRPTADNLEIEIQAAEAAISRLRLYQAERLALLREMEIHRVDAARSMRDWGMTLSR